MVAGRSASIGSGHAGQPFGEGLTRSIIVCTNRVMEYEWDETKRRDNLEKHGIDFADIEEFDWNSALVELAHRQSELRWVALGFIRDRLHNVVFTIRGDHVRIISVRKANARERNKYG